MTWLWTTNSEFEFQDLKHVACNCLIGAEQFSLFRGVHTLVHICGNTTERLKLFPLTVPYENIQKFIQIAHEWKILMTGEVTVLKDPGSIVY